MYMYNDLANKIVLVTGASGDIGLAICRQFLQQQCQVYALYKSHRDGLTQLKSSHPQGEQLHIIPCDLTDGTAIEQLCIYLAKTAGNVDILVNNAGMVRDSLFATMRFEEFSSVIETNLLALFRLTKRALMLLRGSEAPVIINVTSIAALVASPGQINYSASKSAILGFTRTLAAEMAPAGVRVNAVAPGMIESGMVKKVPRTVVRAMINSIPLKRLGQCTEIANAIVYLSSSASSYIVGQTLVIDGGLVMR
ncbi:SDR family oxidoreductase [Erwinia sp. PK3-005]